MRIEVHGKNLEVTPALASYVEKKVNKLEKFWDGFTGAHVTLSVEGPMRTCEVTLPVAGKVLRGEERTEDMYAAIDTVVSKLGRQVRRYRARFEPPRAAATEQASAFGGPAEEAEGALLRTKRFSLKPMPADEAILQMNLVGHDFFVFVDAQTEQVNVVYRRRDGNYGLLQPDV